MSTYMLTKWRRFGPCVNSPVSYALGQFQKLYVTFPGDSNAGSEHATEDRRHK